MENILLTIIFAAIFTMLIVRYISIKSGSKLIHHIYIILRTGFIISLAAIGILVSLILTEINSVVEDIDSIDYAVILGAGLIGDQPSERLKLRLDTAVVTLFDSNIPIIVSGGQGPHERISEAEAMYNYLIENGIDSDRIILEDRSTSTQENIRFSDAYIENDNANVLIITSDYHMFRAKMLGKRADWSIQGQSAVNSTRERSRRMFREIFALMKDIVIC